MILKQAGKTKDVYQCDGMNLLLKFKDDVTGEDGVFNPGANHVGLTMDGIGNENLRMSKYFFELINRSGISTHFVSADLNDNTMIVKEAQVFGQGVEVICRYVAKGSFVKRYGAYIEDGQPLNAYVEMTLKDDLREDPLITSQALEILNIMDLETYNLITKMTQSICKLIQEELHNHDLDLLDIKLEFGLNTQSNTIMLIDEVSTGNMRVAKNGIVLKPFELSQYF